MEPTKVMGPQTAGQPLVEFVRTQRQTAAYALLALSAVFLIASAWLAYRGFRAPKPAPQPDTPLTAPADPPKEIADVNRGDYVVGWIAALTAFLATAAGGVWLLVGIPDPSDERQRTNIRLLLLVVGGAIGVSLILAGLLYFYRWSDSLAKWLDRDDNNKEALWVVIPLLMIVLGAGAVLAAIQPARAEERNKPTIRKTVYWSNFALTVLLLLVGVVVANVVFAKKVPNTLDATETGFYTLGNTTKAFLSKLPQPVNAYLIMPDIGDRLGTDVRQFLLSCQDASEGKFKVKFVSPVSNRNELQALQAKYPKIDRDATGILLTTGPDEKRHSFVPENDLIKVDRLPGGKTDVSFDGENQVMKELRFLADNEQKPVIYFTQSNGEMSIGGEAAALGASATMLRAFLEKNYYDVKPLVFAAQNPTVPDDALVVIVAEPQSPLSPAAAAALRKYMTTPQKDARKGKLIVLAGAAPGPDGKGVARTGLEDLLAEFNVRLGDKYVYSLPTQSSPSYVAATVVFSPMSAQNPITQAISELVRAFGIPVPREVAPLTTNPGFQAAALLQTAPGRPTWLEAEKITNPEETITEVTSVEAVANRKQLTNRPRPVAVVVAEQSPPSMPGHPPLPGGSGRLVVFGSSAIIADDVARRSRSNPVTFDLMSVTIDWLRDRPPAPTEAEAKRYTNYQIPAPDTLDTTRLMFFPLGLMVLLVAGLGTALWAIRRK